MNGSDTMMHLLYREDPPSTEEAKKRIAALWLGILDQMAREYTIIARAISDPRYYCSLLSH